MISPIACLLFPLSSSVPAILYCLFCLEPQMFSPASTSFFFVLQMVPHFSLSVWETLSKSSFREPVERTSSLSSHPSPPYSSGRVDYFFLWPSLLEHISCTRSYYIPVVCLHHSFTLHL